MELLVAQLLNGLTIGGIYALIVMGFNLVVLVTGVLHYAYAHIVVLSMYMAWMTIRATDNIGLGLVAAFLSAIAFSVLTERVFSPLIKKRSQFSPLIVSVALAMVITDVLSHFFNQGQPVSLPMILSTGWADLRMGMVSFPVADIITLVGAVLMVLGFVYLLYNHQQGRAFRAIAQDLDTARMVGIPVNRANVSSFAIAGLLAGVSAVLLIISLGSASPNLGNDLALKALALLLFAGTGNLWGGLLASFILGIAESLTLGYLPGQWSQAIAFGMIAVIIMWRPEGLFGAKV
jgi:branched-chain amino acid transport system permease protein